MIGWRGRVGLIVPATNTTVEYEFWRIAPEGISRQFSRMEYLETQDPKEKEKYLFSMGDYAIDAAKRIAAVKPDIIAFCCTSGSFIKGKEYDKEIIAKIEKETNIPAITTSTAVLEAFKYLNLKKIAMATPYHKEVYEKEVQFFEESIPNFKVISMENLGIVSGLEKGNLFPSSSYISAKEADRADAEAVFISCTAWRTFEIIELLEEDLGKPVITSNQATIWAIFKKMGLHKVEGYGKLLRTI